MNHSEAWGIIYCPTEGSLRTQRRWMRIQAHLNAVEQPFDFVQSEGPGSVERLAAMLTTNGYHTIIVVGGDAALGDALNGIFSAVVDGAPMPVLGTLPNGLFNDFARYWGLHPSQPETTIDALRGGQVRRVDVGRATITTLAGERFERRFLNCVNVGLAASIIKLRRRNHQLWWGLGLLRELTSALMLLLYRHSARMDFRINGENYRQTVTTLCIGSSTGFGQTPSAVPYNGFLDVSVMHRPPLLQAFTGLALLFNRHFLSQKGVSVWRTQQVELSHIGRVTVSVDGHAVHRRVARLDVDIRREAIGFLIPR